MRAYDKNVAARGYGIRMMRKKVSQKRRGIMRGGKGIVCTTVALSGEINNRIGHDTASSIWLAEKEARAKNANGEMG